MGRQPPLTQRGFTLVELLVVIAIIGILVSLLLPAVQAARESGRRAKCQNNLKQLALGCLAHEQAQGAFPHGGWAWYWSGDPDRGFNRRQPGGWIYNLLPYIDQMALRQMGAGLTTTSSPTKSTVLAQMNMVPVPILYCPTRRAAIAYPNPTYSEVNIDPINTVAARTDYAGNAGSNQASWAFAGPGGSDATAADAPGFAWPNITNCDGPICNGGVLPTAAIQDGLSNTYLVGEKYLIPDHYLDGLEGTDNNPVYGGYDWDWMRWSSQAPMPDTPGYSNFLLWGSAHPGTFGMVFCDGSVHSISYSIDPTVHLYLGQRADGKPIDASKF